MADIRIRALPDASPAVPTDYVAIDNGSTRKVPIADLVSVGRPLASQAEAEAGTDPSKAMTPLTTKQSIAAERGVSVQAYSDNLDTLAGIAPGAAGQAILADATDADVNEYLGLTYIKDFGSHTIPLRKFRTTYVDPSDWTSTLQAAADSGEPTIQVHADARVDFNDQWTIDADEQQWTSNGSWRSAELYRTTLVDEPAIVFAGEGQGMRNIGVKGQGLTGMTANCIGVHVIRPNGEIADQDFEFRDGYISGFYYGAQNRGRGFSFSRTLFSLCRYGVNFEWPADADYVEGSEPHQKKTTGFRRLIVESCEFHALAVAGVRNRGANAANAHLEVRNCYSNIGDGIFQGYLGQGSVLFNNTQQNADTIMYTIDGGSDYTVDGVRISGDRTVSPNAIPTNFMTLTGTHVDGRYRDIDATYCNQHGIDMRTGAFTDVIFEQVNLKEVGLSGAGLYDGILILGSGHVVHGFGNTVKNTAAARTVMRVDTGSTLYYHLLRALGAATPATGGGGTATAV